MVSWNYFNWKILCKGSLLGLIFYKNVYIIEYILGVRGGLCEFLYI